MNEWVYKEEDVALNTTSTNISLTFSSHALLLLARFCQQRTASRCITGTRNAVFTVCADVQK
jgi:hypothetical protein